MDIKEFNHNGHTFLEVSNSKNLVITFCDYGASVYAIKYKDSYVTYHPDSYDEFIDSQKYYGKTLGRVCGRLKDGKIIVNEKDYQLEQNERGNTLHGGIHNFSFKTFTHEVNEDDETINVVFKYVSPNGECGFPGEIQTIIIYSLSKITDRFKVHYHAMPNMTTPLNMSSHIYWRLGGDDILDHVLFIKADRRVVYDDKLISVGQEPLDRLFDFQTPKRIGKDIHQVAKLLPTANGYDHGFIFKDATGEVVTLQYEHTKLIVKTDMSMVNIYTNCYPTGGPIKQYGSDVIYGGVAIEPQLFYTSYRDILHDRKNPFDRYISFELGEC